MRATNNQKKNTHPHLNVGEGEPFLVPSNLIVLIYFNFRKSRVVVDLGVRAPTTSFIAKHCSI